MIECPRVHIVGSSERLWNLLLIYGDGRVSRLQIPEPDVRPIDQRGGSRIVYCKRFLWELLDKKVLQKAPYPSSSQEYNPIPYDEKTIFLKLALPIHKTDRTMHTKCLEDLTDILQDVLNSHDRIIDEPPRSLNGSPVPIRQRGAR